MQGVFQLMTDTKKEKTVLVVGEVLPTLTDIESLQQTHKVEIAEKQALITQLFAERDITVESFLKEVAHLKKEIEEGDQALLEAKSFIDDLKAKLNVPNEDRPVVQIGKDKFFVVAGLKTKNAILSAEEISKDIELCEKLVSKNSNILLKK